MTPDGIDTTDWDRVKELAAHVVNASADDDEALGARCTEELLRLLDRLEEKYGELPSILATKADYIDDVLARLELLERAHKIAMGQGDTVNQTLTASSVAQVYIEELKDARKGRSWLEILRVSLEQSPDRSEKEEFERLSKVLDGLA
jgi:hypothetical protein